MAPNHRRPAEAGFTLVELLVVLAVMGLLAGAAVWRWPAGSGASRSEAVQLATRIAAARDQAIISGRPLGLIVDSTGYRFERRRRSEWIPSDEPALVPRRWRQVVIAGGREQRVRFDAVGLPDREATFDLTSGTNRSRVRLLADGSVDLS